MVLITKQQLPGIQQPSGAAWYKFTGGLLGAIFSTSVIVSVQRLNVADFLALVVAGHLVTALLFDHFCLLGSESPVTLTGALGAIALIAGAYLIKK